MLRGYLTKVTARSRAQVTRDITRWVRTAASTIAGRRRRSPLHGSSHIPGRFAKGVNAFARDLLSDYRTFHRLCHVPTVSVDATGKLRKHGRYPDILTPCEQLKSWPAAPLSFKPGITFQGLNTLATRCRRPAPGSSAG